MDKWGDDYDLELTRTEYMGKASLYLNVMPWTLGKEPCRHADEEEYLSHLQVRPLLFSPSERAPPMPKRSLTCRIAHPTQALAELLVRWGRVSTIMEEVRSTTKLPRRGTIPLKTVPLRLNLDEELVRSFMP